MTDGAVSESQALNTIEARLARFEDEHAILNVMYRYGEALDYGDADGFVACFSEEGSWTANRRYSAQRRFSGHQELNYFASQHTRAPEKIHKHFLMNPRIRIEGSSAYASSYFMRVDADETGGPSRVYGMGRYLDVFEKSPDGEWRFRSRVAEIEDDWPAENELSPSDH